MSKKKSTPPAPVLTFGTRIVHAPTSTYLGVVKDIREERVVYETTEGIVGIAGRQEIGIVK